jgi:hypothetical protein
LAIRNEKVQEMVIDQFESMEGSLNAIEEMLEDVVGNEAKIGWHFGTIRENYRNITELLSIFPEEEKK